MAIKDLIPWNNKGREVGFQRGTDIHPFFALHCRSMKIAQPASLPPGLRSSGGISRSTAASISDASSAVKNIQGPGRTGSGGVAVPGDHGIAPEMVRALPLDALTSKKAADE